MKDEVTKSTAIDILNYWYNWIEIDDTEEVLYRTLICWGSLDKWRHLTFETIVDLLLSICHCLSSTLSKILS